jgi:tRNA A37 threonylcarbamoyladenosine modification protein TsaB
MADANPARTTGIILAIEASNPSSGGGGVCVGQVEGGLLRVLAEQPLDADARSSDGVMHAVQLVCAGAGVGPGTGSGIGAVAVSVGPGGFTALRIATTTAKTLGFALRCPVIAVPTAEVAARAVAPGLRPAVIALAAKNDASHLTLLHPDGRCEALGVRTAGALTPGMAATIVADGYLPKALAERAAALGMARVAIELTARACLEASLAIGPAGPDGLSPIYAREPDAVTQWRARHGGSRA